MIFKSALKVAAGVASVPVRPEGKGQQKVASNSQFSRENHPYAIIFRIFICCYHGSTVTPLSPTLPWLQAYTIRWLLCNFRTEIVQTLRVPTGARDCIIVGAPIVHWLPVTQDTNNERKLKTDDLRRECREKEFYWADADAQYVQGENSREGPGAGVVRWQG